jgi:hypothetical protein
MATSPSRRLEADDTPGPIIETGPEKLIDEVPAGTDYKQLMADEAFMAEPVVILLHPLGQAEAEPQVPVGVNGDRAYITPGKPTSKDPRAPDFVRRYHVGQLLKARPDYVTHNGGEVNAPEANHNRFFRQSTSRYNFDVLEDTPKGVAWLKELRRQYTRR